MSSITCHRQSHGQGGYPYSLPHGHHHNNSNNSRPLHIVQTITPTVLGPGTGIPPSCLAGSQLPPSLDISSNLNTLADTKATLELTEITVDTSTSPVSHDIADDMGLNMEVSSTTNPNVTPELSPACDKPRISKRKRTSSPPSPSSTSPGDHRRSSSRSTRHSAQTARQSSLHSHRRAATITAPLTPSVPSKDLEAKREDLLALHRESCRLFQDSERTIPTQYERASLPPTIHDSPPHTVRTSSETGSPPVSPIFPTRFSTVSEDLTGPDNHKGPMLITNTIHDESYIPPIQTSVTVIDWTSPSTRRREYKKIDRASSGVRGFWRRVAPKWCQFGHDRTPFFEEKGGKGNYEGSVRRFRMDLPDEPAPERKMNAIRALKLKQMLVTTKMSSRRKSE
ncbi:hypothetical protein F9C07_5996 [Aspergillus flavus]|uniref:Uncharacterized protein n=6 Tax=Aspergillus subgen. Circumdati TaxID=2720871 RepID=B8NBU4_ASPFN|nr:unnamed protein product [Aspergillus oryzae RIB40]XP_041150532.1 uncharacterized protein G4B84_011020 [Aspergillus flavus NRRL3357]EIT78729.1 hypothetical protein Ao3042_05025 [Aspergillus oryzae 3.042]KAB8242543.1 hypothetical protein BDV35DRAFT_26077 [Aspergillus flavus]KDE82437.1 hypothetical protein AO1008_08994 [Aspergillus oryzae 100-8]KJJ30728.1 hypothetical protein AFLA70_44g003980 [Aspergillus flavus AF70]OOO07242.1 hypothetical protein OAory_01094450 [Aspergillus oryzae]GMG46649|eukprot:EIT78729.1 hypothetical protein Ao3042_05025 [Aspergillus oryzae 3.042]